MHVPPDDNYRTSPAERTGAVLTEGRIRATAGRSAGEDNVFERGARAEWPHSQCFLPDRWRAGHATGGRLPRADQTYRSAEAERLGHTAIRPVQIAVSNDNCDPAVAGRS